MEELMNEAVQTISGLLRELNELLDTDYEDYDEWKHDKYLILDELSAEIFGLIDMCESIGEDTAVWLDKIN